MRDVDDYDRLLRYVYVGKSFVNEELLKAGYAKAVVFPPDTKYQENFGQLEKDAIGNKLGIWSLQCLS